MKRVLADLRAAFGSRTGGSAAEPEAATTGAARARHRAEPIEDAVRRTDDRLPTGRHRAYPAAG
jgi:hypothetical protein